MDTLGERLAYLLNEELCIYPSTLTRLLKRSNNYIADVISGNNKNPSESLFNYLMRRYNVNPAWLKLGKGEIFLEGGKVDNYSSTQMLRAIDELAPENQAAMWDYLSLLQKSEKYDQINMTK